jgi:hypothetical protein
MLSYEKDMLFRKSHEHGQKKPAFIIEKSDGSNPELLPGAYPLPSFKVIIDKKIGGG